MGMTYQHLAETFHSQNWQLLKHKKQINSLIKFYFNNTEIALLLENYI